MSTIKRFAHWLGLGPDEIDPYAEHVPPHGDHHYEMPAQQHFYPASAPPEPQVLAEPMAAPPPPPQPQQSYEYAPADTAFPVSSTSGSPSGVSSTVRPLNYADPVKPMVINPRSYEDAQEIGEQFKNRQPVIVNLEDVDLDLRRRLIDFVSGLCFGLDGKVERVTLGVYLLSPSDVKVAMDDPALSSSNR